MKRNKKNYSEWLLGARKKLAAAQIPSANLDAMLLLEYEVKKNKETILTYPESLLTISQKYRLNRLLKKRIRHTPIAYLINKKEFYGKEFYINKNVLIPRPETESFISLIEKMPTKKNLRVIDLGTGSGVLAITIKSLHPKWELFATDISKKALTIARKNAKKNEVTIHFKKSDIFNSIDNDFDIVIANLPYVPSTHYVLEEVKKEPAVAIFSGKDGLDHYRSLFMSHFKNNSLLLIECLEIQQKKIKLLAQRHGFQLIGRDNLVYVFKKIK